MRVDHENSYVRISVAAALAEAVEQWPQSVSPTIGTLRELYRDKVGSPEVQPTVVTDDLSRRRYLPQNSTNM